MTVTLHDLLLYQADCESEIIDLERAAFDRAAQDSVEGRSRPMTGFLASLADAQRVLALSFKGPDLLGDRRKLK